MSLATTLRLIISATETLTSDLGNVSWPIRQDWSDSLATGTGLDQADKMWGDTRTLTATTSEELDLAGSLTHPGGGTITFARVKLLAIRNKSTTAGDVLNVGGAASNGFSTLFGDATDKLVIRPGGVLLLVAPDATAYAVTAGTGDKLKVDNPGSNSVSYDVLVIGASA